MSKTLFKREKRIFLIYHFYLFNWSKEEFFDSALNDDFFSFNKENLEVIKKIFENLEETEKKISSKLINWEWNRIPPLEKAVLINGLSEINIFSNKKQIVISESIKFVKKYCKFENYKYINAVLD